jgi:phosphomannomutase
VEQPLFHVVEPNYEGVRIAFDDEEVKGWLLIRKSLHDPVLPMNIESKEAGGTDVILERINDFFARYKRLSV